MKRLVWLMLVLWGTAANCMAQKTEVEASIMRCAANIHTTISMFVNNMPVFDVSTTVDSLYRNLIIKPENVRTNYKYIGMIPLQAYFILTNDSRVDFEKIEECLTVCGNHEALLGAPMLFCAMFFAKKMENVDQVKAAWAYELAEKANDLVFEGKRSQFSDTIDLKLSLIYFNERQWSKAIKYQERLANQCEPDTEEGFGAIKILAFLNQMYGNFQVADSCYQLCLDFLVRHGLKDGEDYIDILISRARIMMEVEEYDEAERLLLSAQKACKKDNAPIMDVWNELSILYGETGDDRKALDVLRKALSYYEKSVTTEDAKDIAAWIVACDNPNIGNEPFRLQKMLEKLLPTDDITTLCDLCRIYQKTGAYDKADATRASIENVLASMSPEQKEEYTDELMGMYTALNLFGKVQELTDENIEKVVSIVGKNHPLYLETLLMKGEYYALSGDYYKALETYNECLKFEPMDEERKIEIYEKVASVYGAIGEMELATNYLDYILDNTHDLKMREQALRLYVGCMISELDIIRNDINESASRKKDSMTQAAIEKAKELNELCVSLYGKVNVKTLDSYQLLASAYNLAGDNERMISIAEETEKLIRKNVKNDEWKKPMLESLTAFYVYAKKYKKAHSLIDYSILDDKSVHADIKDFTLFALSEINLLEGNYEEGQKYYTELANLRIDQLSQQMATLKSQSRQQYWRKYRQEMLNAAKFATNLGEQDEFAGVVYNLALYAKRLLLGSDNAFRFAILESGNQDLKDKYDALNSLRVKLTQNHADKSSSEYAQNVELADLLEKELLSAVDANSFTQDRILWPNVQETLGTDGIAIEMLEYKDKDERAKYGAVMIRKDWRNPVVVNLGDKDSMDKMLSASGLLPDSTTHLWKEILPYLQGITNIFISPTGIFNQIPIEYMSEVENYTIFRLTSTAELCVKHNETSNDAVIYGGLLYKDGMKQAVTADLENRGTITLPYLEGTLAEATAIDSVLNRQYHTKVKRGLEGTEQSFKDLSGKHTSIIHIGTHGKYTALDRDNSRLLQHVVSKGVGEDHALTRSCLFMSGALDALSSTDDNDGILTALEVSTLDLRGLDLVTLSACETAKGDITGDGVFGLQRGFKKAGARSILMSLRKVNDKATRTLMTDFYEQLSKGCPKHKALRHAQEKVRENPRWKEPRFWAPFILLDAIP